MGWLQNFKIKGLLYGIEKKAPQERQYDLLLLRHEGPVALPAIRAKAKHIRHIRERILDLEIELNQLVLAIERDYGIGLIGRLMGPASKDRDV